MADEGVIMRSKEVFYRGQNVEDLKKLDAREVAKFIPSRSRRSVLRNFQNHESFIKRCETQFNAKKKIKTHLRDIVILPRLVGMTIGIHAGKSFTDLAITHRMIGHRLGEFALTRTKVQHGNPGLGSTKSSGVEKK
ncbi:30S ribosomal protein S19 [Candidatus Pacearchaeota archaeon]|nr:30S ribosomal protein S19 [Candidatus Pacearchaeota archaeon]